MKLNNKAQGWLTVTAIILALGLVGHVETAEAREVVCMPTVDDPQPADDTRKIPASWHF